jgi:hypothetical protein
MQIQSGTYQSLVAAEMRISTPVVDATPAPPESASFPVHREVKAIESPQTENLVTEQREKKKEDQEPQLSRQLVEIQGNPEATAAHAAKVQRALSPPINPYPSVQELATVRRAEAMERAAKAELKEVEPEVVDQKV